MMLCFTFHGLGEPNSSIENDEKPYWVNTERFEECLDLFASASNPVQITFDDGNQSDILIALPSLKRRGIKAKFFVVSQRIGQENYLSEDEIRFLHSEGMEIGCHGYEHVPWTGLDDAELERQVGSGIDRLCEIVKRPVDEVAVPLGKYNRRVLTILRRLRVKRVYTSDQLATPPVSWIIPRTSIRADTPLSSVRRLCMQKHTLSDQAKTLARLWRRRTR